MTRRQSSTGYRSGFRAFSKIEGTDASKGRKLYHALKVCEKNKNFTEESGLGIQAQQVKPIWQEFERRVLALATASYDLAFLRADAIRQHLIHMEEDE